MKQAIKQIFAVLATMFAGVAAFAQVTTSSISGHVYDETGDVAGAAVIVVHTPSGTQYHALTDDNGNYRIHNMRVGGPYTVNVDMLGYAPVVVEGVTLKLGETFIWDVELSEETIALEAVTISADAQNTVMTSEKAGTSSNFSRRDMINLPTGSRTINDVVRLTPQSNGMSFAGRDNRMNNFSVDGAGFNNNFGLNSDLPGGDSGPISFDAIEEISVNIAPYDVRQSRFTGASINAVTKSGTNEFDGSVYTYQQFKGMHGEKVGDGIVEGAKDLTQQTYGFSIGGPIVKNKLFFFVNAEYSPMQNPGPSWRPSTDGVSNTEQGISRTTIADLERVKDHLMSKYGYDAGEYGNGGWSSFDDYNYKIMARIDWNINDNHKLMLRYNDVMNSVMNTVSSNSCPSGLDRSDARISASSIAFSNSNYRMNNSVRSIAAELNSKFSEKASNQLLLTYNMISDKRSLPSDDIFPFVDIYKDGSQYMSFGTELFSFNNAVINNTANITDNLTLNLDKHTLTIGASFEYMFVKNSYIREGTSYYRYASVDDFINDEAPIGFGITYGYNGEDAPGVKLNYGQFNAYIQDEYEINRKFKLTYGVRFEMPVYLDNDMVTNYAILQKGYDNNFAGGPWDTGTWPKSRITVNPRVGFNWDVLGDRSLQIRGGTGLFSGVNPFVWFTNQASAAGFVQSQEMALEGSDLASALPGLTFTRNYKDLMAKYPNTFPTTANPSTVARNASICLVDKDFKFPQIWRSNLAVDVRLPWNMVFTGELLYTKDVVGVWQQNVNLAAPAGLMAGADNRYVWLNGNNRVDSSLSSAMLLTNNNMGHAFQATAQLTKNFSKGFSGMIAYTYSNSKDVTANPGSTAFSVWQSNRSVNSLNVPELGYSNYSVPHRVVANLSYRVEYARNFATTISLFYQGAHNGRVSYVYNGDVNGDGQSADLMYVPRDRSEINFVDMWYVTSDKNGHEISRVQLASAEEQADAFFEYIDNNKYLKSRKGKYVERYGGLQKWVSEVDVKILQDVYTNFGSNNRYSLQLSLDILNVANLLNRNWGCYYTAGMLNYQDMPLLNVVTPGTTSTAPTFTLNSGDASKVPAGKGVDVFKSYSSWERALNAANCWSMLLGIRLTF